MLKPLALCTLSPKQNKEVEGTCTTTSKFNEHQGIAKDTKTSFVGWQEKGSMGGFIPPKQESSCAWKSRKPWVIHSQGHKV